MQDRVPSPHPRARMMGQGHPPDFPSPPACCERQHNLSNDSNTIPTLRAPRVSEQSLALISDCLLVWE